MAERGGLFLNCPAAGPSEIYGAHRSADGRSAYTVWKENELFFENAPLPEVLQKVEDYYGVKILLQDTTLTGKRFTSSLPNNNLDVVLKSIASVYHLEVSRKQNRVILR
jgi:ferric-dicitrate binding protein FerR (iron transport regulator)